MLSQALSETIQQADHDLLWAAVITAGLAFVGTVIGMFLANQNKKAAHAVADEILEELNTGNGHTAGQALSRLEEQLWRHENRLDAVDVRLEDEIGIIAEKISDVNDRLDVHDAETRPIRDWVVEQIEKREEQQDG